MNYYNENDPFAVKWLKALIASGLIPKGDVILNQGLQVDNSSGQLVRGMSGITPTPFQATCNFLKIATHHFYENPSCGQHPKPCVPHKIHIFGELLDLFYKTYVSLNLEAFLLWFSRGISLPAAVFFCGMFGRKELRLRAGTYQNKAIYCVDLDQLKTLFHKFGIYAVSLVIQHRVFSTSVLYNGENNISDGYAIQAFLFHIRYKMAVMICFS